ncbi:MAG TPA: hypothetical protein VMM78_13650 [Thermomicrobiales bacterium]|nr:hypothetical protein [Thermomicrobiales bacterium]
MNRESSFSGPEIIGISIVAAASLGGIIVALGRSQAAAAKSQVPQLSDVQDAARHQLEHGRTVARSAAAAVADSYPGIRDSAVDLLSRAAGSAAPQATRAAEIAASGAQSARATGSHVLEHIQEVVIPTAADVLVSLRDRASDAASKSSAPASGVVARSGVLADAAVTRSTNALREALALAIWISAAASLIYYVLLDEERREKLRAFLFGAYEQTRLLIQDFQGYDEDV